MPRADITFDLHIESGAPDLIGLLARADALAHAIRSVPIPPELRDRLDRLHIQRAVRGTTGIEGIDVSEQEVARIFEHDAPALPAPRAQVEMEVRNAAAVMLDIGDALAGDISLPVTEALIARIHRVMTAGLPYDHNSPGVYRSHAVTVGGYAPPRTHDELIRLMREFVAWLHGPRCRALHPIVRAIAAHYYLVSIHPFGDGNGRTSRAVESFLLYQARINVLGFYSLSNFYYRRHDEYIGLLGRTQLGSDGDLTPFVRFAVGGLVEELEEIWEHVAREMRSVTFMNHAHRKLILEEQLSAGAGERMYRLVLELEEPVAIAEIIDGRHPLGRLYRKLSTKTFRRDLAFLQKINLVTVEDRKVRANLALVDETHR